MDIKQKLCNLTNYRLNRTQDIKYIVIHYTANNGDTASGNANYFANNANLQASAHYFVDEFEIYNSVPDFSCAWHCGGTSYVHPDCRNDNAIGIEMCSRKDSNGNYYFKEGTINNAIELVKEKMVEHNIDVDHVIMHWHVTGKKCPAPFVDDESKWIDFKLKLSGEEIKIELWQQAIIDKAVKYGLITEGQHIATDTCPKWFVLQIVINLLEKYILKIK